VFFGCLKCVSGDGMQPGDCNVTVEKLADYLKDNGY